MSMHVWHAVNRKRGWARCLGRRVSWGRGGLTLSSSPHGVLLFPGTFAWKKPAAQMRRTPSPAAPHMVMVTMLYICYIKKYPTGAVPAGASPPAVSPLPDAQPPPPPHSPQHASSHATPPPPKPNCLTPSPPRPDCGYHRPRSRDVSSTGAAWRLLRTYAAV